MRIRLKNFRCYEDNTFELGTNGITLISAPSGYGKSTILNGIYFALFGVGNKVTTFGKTSCLVELEFEDIKITRTKRPNRLIVSSEDSTYEDDVAQQVINSKFGENFDVTGYICQNAMNSFIMMNPLEKLSFLERFAFKDIDLNDIKLRCKSNITKTHDELIANESQLQMAKNILAELKKPDEIKFPIKCKKSQIELAIKNENVKFKNCNTLINRAQNNIDKKEKELNSIQVLKSIISTRSELIDSLNNKINEIDSQLERINLENTDEIKLEKHKMMLSNLLLRKEMTDLEIRFKEDSKKLDNMRIQEEADFQVQLENINNELWQEFSPEELCETLDSLSSTLNDIDKIENIKKDLARYSSFNITRVDENELKLERLKKELEIKNRLLNRLNLQKELYSCPSCNAKLRLVKNNLCLENDTVNDIDIDMNTLKNEISTLNNNVSNLTRMIENDKYALKLKTELELNLNEIVNSYEEIPDKTNIKNDINYLKEYQLNQRNLEKRKKTIEDSIRNATFSSSYNSFKNNVFALEKQLNKLKTKYQDTPIPFTENDLRDMIQTESETISLFKRLNSNKGELCNEKKKNESILLQTENEHKSKYQELRDEIKLKTEIKQLKNEILSIENKREEHSENLRLIDDWKRAQNDIETYNQWKDKIITLETDCDISRQKHSASMILKEKILEAESIALLNIIDTINTHVQLYLEAFFPDEPITITLQTFKETKKNTKPSINLFIEYKGMECDLNMLSGGELSRVILAYTLALGEIFNTPLLMLDESTASLDQNMTSCVFNGIREHFNGKLVIIIAHQIVEGGFDTVIKLDKVSNNDE